MTFQGNTSTSTGSVVASCDNVDAGPVSSAPEPVSDASVADALPDSAAPFDAPVADALRDGATTWSPAALRSKLTFWFDPTSLVQAGGTVVPTRR
jgi:hypothetical protein